MSVAQNIEGDEQPRYSIDLSLELEHELNNEPDAVDAPTRPRSLDPHVLASIVAQLRTSILDTTKERDELNVSLAESLSRENGLQDMVDHMAKKCAKMQEELDIANAKIKDDEDAIGMLRSKVEESRRGLMRLQTEGRRASQGPNQLDLSRASVQFGGPSSSKRSSFALPTSPQVSRLNNHRRISSDAGFSLLSSPPQGQALSDHVTTPPSNSRRMSGMFGRVSPQPQCLEDRSDDNAGAETESLRLELKAVKNELEEVKHELMETVEAREASELCVKALREFIQEHKVGEHPVPSDNLVKTATLSGGNPSAAETHKPSFSNGAGWAFKLWRGEEANKATPSNIPVVAYSVPPLTKKLGGFFSSRPAAAGESSPLRHSQLHDQVPLYNGLSDTSSVEESVAEPVSPSTTANEFPAGVIVRDVSAPSSIDFGGLDQSKERPESLLSSTSK